MTVTIKVYDSDLTTLIATLDEPYDIAWSHELLTVGGGTFTIPHDSAVVTANPSVLSAENVVVVAVDGTDVSAWVVRGCARDRGETWDPVTVSGPHVVELLRQALVYPRQGLVGDLQDTRLFAWQSLDYVPDGDWTTPTTLGTFANPTDDSLNSISGGDEVQTVELNAEASPFPWGPSYPSPGGLPGTFTLSHEGNTTSALAYDASLAQIETALEALPHIDGVTVGGTGPGSTFTVTFDGASVAGQQQNLLKVNHSQLRHSSPAQGAYVVRTTAGGKSVDGDGILEGWPDPEAVWMGTFGTEFAYRRELRVDDDGTEGTARLYVTSLDDFDVWWDGEWLGSGGNLDVRTFTLDLSPTEHIVAVRASAPTLVTIVTLTEDGEPDGVLYRSYGAGGRAPGWQAYEGDPPGVTPGYLVKTLFDEASARGYLPQVTVDFTDALDSNGDAWTIDVETGVQVGNDSVLSVAERLRDLGIYFHMAPDFTLSMWEGVRADRGATPDTATVTVATTDVSDVSVRTADELLTTLLVRTSDSWVERHVAGPRREGFVSLGTVPSAAGAQTIADIVLDDFQTSRQTFRWTVHSDQAGVPVVFTDYALGDVIVGPLLTSLAAASWSTGDVRVDTIAVEVTENGELRVIHEVTAA